MALLPPFVRPGTKIDVTVASVGQAQNLQGGYLVLTPLRGADGEVHALAQGPVSIGGFAASAGAAGGGSASVQKNHTVVGIIPGGGRVEGEPIFQTVLQPGNVIRWLLKKPDFKTANNLERKINSVTGVPIALAEDAASVSVQVTVDRDGGLRLGNQPFNSLVGAIAFIDELRIATDEPAKIVINERTGTVVAGQDIQVREVMIAHGPLRITIKATEEIVQPTGFGEAGETAEQKNVDVQAEEGDKPALVIQGTTVGDVVANLNALGYTPRDLIAIFEAMAAAGAIKAEVVMMQ